MKANVIFSVFLLIMLFIVMVNPVQRGIMMAMARERKIEKQNSPKLEAISDWAEIILAAPWAGEKSEFGFISNELYAADSDGKRYVRLTHNRCHYNHFAVSPDRRMIAAIRYSSGDSNRDGIIDFRDRKTLWILDLENQEEWSLVPEYDTGWGGVDWSPDSRSVYVSIFKDFKSDIYHIPIDGSDLQNITYGLEKSLTPDLPQKWVSDTGVSHDGKWIVFLYSGRKAGPGAFREPVKSRVAVCRSNGREPRLITDGGDIQPLANGLWGPGDFDPEFSPDGKHICFQRATSVSTNFSARIPSHDIMRINIDGRGLMRLSPEGNPGIHGISDWSEDNRIVFSEWNERDRYIGPVMVNADGSNYHRLTELPPGGTHVRWIPAVKK